MADVTPRPAVHKFDIKPIIKEKLSSSSTRSPVTFHPQEHLAYSAEPKVLSLKDIGLSGDIGLSPVAISEPFPLFTEEAIGVMRGEVFTKEVWEKCLYNTEAFGCQLRGHCPKYAPFMYDAWTNPETVAIISKVAGLDLIHNMDLEVGNINISVQEPPKSYQKMEKQSDDDIPTTKWHFDSYPFVCVVMMSDASNMIGGETAIKTGTGNIIKVRGPQKGSAVILQGRHIMHQALAAVGGTERITMITAFRPRDPLIPDTSVLTTIRPLTDHSLLYFQWTEYRVEVLQERLRIMLEILQAQHRAGQPTDVVKVKDFLKQQEEWLMSTNREILPA